MIDRLRPSRLSIFLAVLAVVSWIAARPFDAVGG